MRHARPERLHGLPGERASALVDDRDRDPDRELGGHVHGGREGRLRVQGVEDRLDQEEVDAAVTQGADLLGVGRVDVVERDRPEGGIVDLGGEREGHVERAHRAGHESVAVGVGGLAGEPGALDVHVADRVLQPVVGLADRRGREGVRGRDIGPGLEVGPVDLADDVGPGDVQQVRVTLHVALVAREALATEILLGQPPALQEHAPGAVEHDDALGEQALQACTGVHPAI